VLLHRFTQAALYERELRVLSQERGLGVLWLPGHRSGRQAGAAPVIRSPVGTDARMVTATAVMRGALAGLVGGAVMTATEAVEQRMTGRPASYVPGRALLRLTGRRAPESARPTGWNWAMHYGTAALLGALRGVWAEVGLRGPLWSGAHTVVRLATDQTLENVSGAGAPPQTWPARERVVDVTHKAAYSVTTGLLSDWLVRQRPRVLPGRVSH
jgi:hypothetical protein